MSRRIAPALVDYLDAKFVGNDIFAAALNRGDSRLIFQLAGHALVGVRESGGNNRGKLVELLQSTLGGADREPWCMSLVQSCLAYAEHKTRVESPIYASEHCLTVWNETPAVQRVRTVPAPGAIIIWRHGSTTNGHTGLTVGPVIGGRFPAVEGNTDAGLVDGRIERDGGGVYYSTRGLEGDGTMRVVGFLKPFALT